MQPPQNPYNQSGGTPYGTPPYGVPGMQQPRGRVTLDVIGEAWNILSSNMGTWIGAGAIYFGIVAVLNLLQRLTMHTDARGLPQSSPLSFVFTLIGLFVGQFIIGGMLRMALTTIKGGRAEVSQLFSAGDIVLPLVIAALITGLACGVGFLLCFVPGLIALSGLMLAPTIIADGRGTGVSALGESWNAVKPSLWMGVLLLIVLGLIFLVGLIPCGLGTIITFPLIQISFVLVYRDLFGIGGNHAATSGYAPPPIANPNF